MVLPLHPQAALLFSSLTDNSPIPFDPLAAVPAIDSRMEMMDCTIWFTALSTAVKADRGTVLIIFSTSPIPTLSVFNKALISVTKVDNNDESIVDEPPPDMAPPNPPIEPDAPPDPEADDVPRTLNIFSISVITALVIFKTSSNTLMGTSWTRFSTSVKRAGRLRLFNKEATAPTRLLTKEVTEDPNEPKVPVVD